jgi:hypothetical protein
VIPGTYVYRYIQNFGLRLYDVRWKKIETHARFINGFLVSHDFCHCKHCTWHIVAIVENRTMPQDGKSILESTLGKLLGFDDGAEDVLDHLLTIESKEVRLRIVFSRMELRYTSIGLMHPTIV